MLAVITNMTKQAGEKNILCTIIKHTHKLVKNQATERTSWIEKNKSEFFISWTPLVKQQFYDFELKKN